MRSITATRGFLAALLGLAIFASPASAAIIVYDLRVDFSNASNPNGTWQYLKGNTLLTHFTPVTNPTLALAAANGYWGDTASSNNSAIMLTTADGSATGLWADSDFLQDEVLVRTTDPPGAAMNVTWTAPSAGTLTYNGGVWLANGPLGPGMSSFTLDLNNGPALESGVVGPVSGYTNGVGMVNGQTPMNVLAGDVFTLEIAALPGPSGALTGVTFTIDFQPIPEPSSCALAGIGLVGLLACARRRSSRR
jgi:hypothetical protein